jgi:hypothetical protein
MRPGLCSLITTSFGAASPDPAAMWIHVCGLRDLRIVGNVVLNDR